MGNDEFLRAFEEALEIPLGALHGTEKFEELEGWDSVAMVTVMSLVDEKCGVQLSPRRIAACATVNDLYNLTQAS